MKYIQFLILISIFMNDAIGSENTGVVTREYEDGMAVLYTFDRTPASKEDRGKFPIIAIVGLKYDGTSTKGMPGEEVLEEIYLVEEILEDNIVNTGLARHGYNRVGNGLREMYYYISDAEIFLKTFNDTATNKVRFEWSVEFFHDPEWEALGNRQRSVGQ